MLLITFKQPQLAYTFADYMRQQGVILRVVQSNTQYALYLDNEAELAHVQKALEHFLRDPNAARYRHLGWQNEATQMPPNLYRASQFKALLPKFTQSGPLTVTVAVLCLLVYLAQQFLGDGVVFYYLGWASPAHLNYQVWRWLTPILMHFSFLHILFNLTWWWYLGRQVEARLGWKKLLLLLLVTGILSNYGQFSVSGPFFGGLSGVVYGLIGYVWLMGEKAPQRGLILDRGMITIAVIWLIAGYTGLLGPIANTAHLIGFVVGLVLAFKESYVKSR